MIFRLSQKLNSKIKAGVTKAVPLNENPFADWTAHLFVVDRTQYILLSNTKSLYSTVMYGKGILDERSFIDHALSNLMEFMADDGQQFIYHRFIAPAAATVRFAKALDRQVTGSMNQLVLFASDMLIGGDMAPYEVGFKLNDVLLSAIAPNKAKGYGRPREAFKRMGIGNEA